MERKPVRRTSTEFNNTTVPMSYLCTLYKEFDKEKRGRGLK